MIRQWDNLDREASNEGGAIANKAPRWLHVGKPCHSKSGLRMITYNNAKRSNDSMLNHGKSLLPDDSPKEKSKPLSYYLNPPIEL